MRMPRSAVALFIVVCSTPLVAEKAHSPTKWRSSRAQCISAVWSQSGVANWDATRINDGSIVSGIAGTVTQNDSVTVDLGSAKEIRELRAWFSPMADSDVVGWIRKFRYSDDGVSFSPDRFDFVSGWVDEAFPFGPASVGWAQLAGGAHRYWRFFFEKTGAVNSAMDLVELQLYERPLWIGALPCE